MTKQTLFSIHSPQDPASLYLSEPTNPIVGFLAPYHSGGTLKDIIPCRVRAGTLGPEVQAKWSRQLTSALLHAFTYENGTDKSRCGIYTTLRMDNIVLTSPEEGLNVILIDFEKSSNYSTYSAPEIGWIGSRWSPEPTDTSSILGRHNSKHRYMGSSREYQYEDGFWKSATNKQRESAMVFSLAACLWCIFEGKGCLTDMPWRYELGDDYIPISPHRFRFRWQKPGREKFSVPRAARDIVMKALKNSHEDRPTLEEIMVVIKEWEEGLGQEHVCGKDKSS